MASSRANLQPLQQEYYLVIFESVCFNIHAIFRTQCGNNIRNCVCFLIVGSSRNSLVGTAIRLRAGRSSVRIQVGVRDFSPLQKHQICSGATPVAYSIGVKCSPPSTAEVKNEWSCTSTHPMSSWPRQGKILLLTCICLTAGVNLLTPSGHRQIRDVITTGLDMCGPRMRKGGGGGWTIHPSRR